jgi:hypothetical protein
MNQLVFTFRIISNEEENFRRDFEIRANQTFFDLHLAIQENLGFDKSQMASFVLTNEKWEREEEINLFDIREEPSDDTLIMDKVRIGEACSDIRQKLLYIFDFFSDRGFFIELVEKGDEDPAITYPRCTLATGKIPIQIIIDDNNIDAFPTEEFDDLESFDDDISFESLDDYGEL